VHAAAAPVFTELITGSNAIIGETLMAKSLDGCFAAARAGHPLPERDVRWLTSNDRTRPGRAYQSFCRRIGREISD
jgi:hypothetical protein